MTWLKSIGAVIAGFLIVVIGSEGSDWVLRAADVFPPLEQPHAMTPALYAIALAHRGAWGVAGAFAAARLAPRSGMTHALVLGLIGTALSTLGAIVMWHVGDHWYPITLAATAMPLAWLGGRLAARGGAA